MPASAHRSGTFPARWRGAGTGVVPFGLPFVPPWGPPPWWPPPRQTEPAGPARRNPRTPLHPCDRHRLIRQPPTVIGVHPFGRLAALRARHRRCRRPGPYSQDPALLHHLMDDQQRHLWEQGIDQITGTPASADQIHRTAPPPVGSPTAAPCQPIRCSPPASTATSAVMRSPTCSPSTFRLHIGQPSHWTGHNQRPGR
jgi:hypothetical protein